MVAARQGVVAMIYPGAFNLTYPWFGGGGANVGLDLCIGSYWPERGLWIIRFMWLCVLLREI